MKTTQRVMRWMGAAIAVSGIAGLSGCGSSSDGTGPVSGPVVNASPSLVFAPNEIDIGAGESVTFTFGSVDHTVVFQIGATGAPQNIGATHNKNVTRTFSTPGTFTYICSLHPGMTGSVVVGGVTTQTGSGYYVERGGR